MRVFFDLFRGYDGRIQRLQFWIGLVALALASFLVSNLISLVAGINIDPATIDYSQLDEMALAAAIENEKAIAQRAAWVNIVTLAIFIYPSSALFTKRLHDHGQEGTIFWIYVLISGAILLVQALGVGSQFTVFGSDLVPVPTAFLAIMLLVGLVFGLYLMVVCGMMGAKPAPNRFDTRPADFDKSA